jgi:hypothetical protein
MYLLQQDHWKQNIIYDVYLYSFQKYGFLDVVIIKKGVIKFAYPNKDYIP